VTNPVIASRETDSNAVCATWRKDARRWQADGPSHDTMN
jgi:hypothetical protein